MDIELPKADPSHPYAHCQYNHLTHAGKNVHINLGSLQFNMAIWDWKDGTFTTYDKYCPQQDAVSWVIEHEGIWEPAETAIVLEILRENTGLPVIDIGAQIGWYSILAALHKYPTYAIEVDKACTNMLLRQNILNDLDIQIINGVVDKRAPVLPAEPVHFIKCDIEGSEPFAYEMCRTLFESHSVKYAMFEISPVLNDVIYPELVERICANGYRVFEVPHKDWKRYKEFLKHPLDTLITYCELNCTNRREYITGLHQEDLIFMRE